MEELLYVKLKLDRGLKKVVRVHGSYFGCNPRTQADSLVKAMTESLHVFDLNYSRPSQRVFIFHPDTECCYLEIVTRTIFCFCNDTQMLDTRSCVMLGNNDPYHLVYGKGYDRPNYNVGLDISVQDIRDLLCYLLEYGMIYRTISETKTNNMT